MNQNWITFRSGVVFGLGFLFILIFFVATSILIAQSLTQFSAGDVISSSSINANFQTLETKITTESGIAAPQGAIMASNLATCPTGWVAADGTNSTPDLRGTFIRGLNTFDGGLTTNARDPEDTGARSLGHYQADAFQGHRHAHSGYGSGGHLADNSGGTAKLVSDADSGFDTVGSPTADASGTPRTSTETRPANVTLIYCMRKN